MASLPGLRREGSAVTVDYRVLATVSRTWADFGQAAIALGLVRSIALGYGLRPTLVHGDNPHGDRDVAEIAYTQGFILEPHPAIWRPYGIYNPQAGLVRDREMVKAGADVCLAFIKNGSRGASYTAGLAEAAGIETRRYVA